MSIKESALSAITSIAQGDFVRAVTSGGASRRVTVANLAKAIVESYTGSTLADTSQSVKAALDSLNSKIGNTNYTSKAALYNAALNLSICVATINGATASDITSSKISSTSRVICVKADATTVDMFMFCIYDSKLSIARMTSESTVSKCIIYTGTQA